MPAFTCVNCGNGSLVRSNFKLTPDHRPWCRDWKVCEERRQKWPHSSQYDHHVTEYNLIKRRGEISLGWEPALPKERR